MSRLDKIPGLVLRQHQRTEADLAAIGEPYSAKRSVRCGKTALGHMQSLSDGPATLHEKLPYCGRHLLLSCWLTMAILSQLELSVRPSGGVGREGNDVARFFSAFTSNLTGPALQR